MKAGGFFGLETVNLGLCVFVISAERQKNDTKTNVKPTLTVLNQQLNNISFNVRGGCPADLPVYQRAAPVQTQLPVSSRTLAGRPQS